MADISQLVTDYNTDNLEGLFIDSDNIKNNIYQIISVYNNNIGLLQKYIIKTPKLQIFRDTLPINYKIKKSIRLSVLLRSSDKNIKKFKLYIKRLERRIIKDINIKMENIFSIKKIYKNFPEILNIKMPFTKINNCYEFNFGIYMNKKRVNINKLTSGTNISAFIELSDIWINNGKIGFNWNIKQMKIYPTYDFTLYAFSDSDDDDDYSKEYINECYHCLYCPNNIRTHYCNNSQYNNNIPNITTTNIPPPPKLITNSVYNNKSNNQPSNSSSSNISPFVPSLQDLLNIKLKPVIKDVSENNYDNNTITNIKEAKVNLLDSDIDFLHKK